MRKSCVHRKPNTKKVVRMCIAGCRTSVPAVYPANVKLMVSQIKEAEVDSVNDIGEFLDAELNYYDRCRDILSQLKRDWPAGYH